MAEGRKKTSVSALSISHAHSAALAARMLTLEQDCRQMDHYLEGYTGIYYQHLGVFPEDTQRTIRGLLSEILRKIARIKLDLGLPQRRTEVAKLLAAHLSEIWVTLHETKAHSLRGYGEVPKELSAYLDPRVEELLDLVATLRDAIESGNKPAAPEPGAGK